MSKTNLNKVSLLAYLINLGISIPIIVITTIYLLQEIVEFV